MTLRFRCQCGSRFNVDDSKRGRKGKCPVCGARLRIPTRGSPDGRSVPAAILSPPPPPAPEPPPTPPEELLTLAEDEPTETHEPIRHVDALLEDDELEEMEELEADEEYLSVVDEEPPPPEDDSILAPIDLNGRRTLKDPEKGRTRSFLSAFIYPLSGKGIGMIILAALIFPICIGICRLAMIAPLIGFVGLLGAIAVSAYIVSFYMSVVSETCRGQEVVPNWPDFANAWNEIFRPYFRLIGATIISFLPAFVCIVIAAKMGDESLPSVGDVSGSPRTVFFVGIALGVGGILYLPMAVLGVSAIDSVLAAMPNIVLPAIARSIVDYVLLAIIAVLNGLALIGITWLATRLAPESVIVPLLLALPAFAINAYFTMVLTRMMGLLYRRNDEKIQWGYE